MLSDDARFVVPPFDLWAEVKGVTDAEVMRRLAILKGDDGTEQAA